MKKRISILISLIFTTLSYADTATSLTSSSSSQPNIILIFTDDQGYNDLGSFGSEKIKTPYLDQMAKEGLKLTHFYAQPVCGVSRAALMTGSYPIRVAEPNNIKQLHTVPHPQEITVAETLKTAGYATALIGKWHLAGSARRSDNTYNPELMPNAQGFDYYYGTPKFNGFTVNVEDTEVRSRIMRNEEVVVDKVESWDNITQDYTKEALAWIEKNKDQPFFLYLAHNLPHIPVGASEDFKGKSEYGPYGDTIEEIDWSSGQIIAKLKELNIDENTLVIFTSDNGPWTEATRGADGVTPFIPLNHSGSALPLRGFKMTSWEGGSRVPFIARWPEKIKAGRTSNEILTTLDLYPTFAKIAGATMPERKIDGLDASNFLFGESAASPREDYFYYVGALLTGVRYEKWKLVLPRPANPDGLGWWARMIDEVPEIQLFDLHMDPAEQSNLAAMYPEVVQSLMTRIDWARKELGDIDIVGAAPTTGTVEISIVFI